MRRSAQVMAALPAVVSGSNLISSSSARATAKVLPDFREATKPQRVRLLETAFWPWPIHSFSQAMTTPAGSSQHPNRRGTIHHERKQA